MEKLKGEVSVLRSKLECERARADELAAQLQLARKQLEERARAAADLRAQLAQLKRYATQFYRFDEYKSKYFMY